MQILPFSLILGFILGIKHAFEADHVIAVSTIVTQQKNPFKAALVGAFWGIGHTTTLLITGIIILFLKLSIPLKVSMLLEMGVGIMLIFLGFRAIKKSKLVFHTHRHQHEGEVHEHLHQEGAKSHKHHVPFVIGLIHGLAGSGALMLLVLSTVSSVAEGLYYTLLFGVGSILGMSLMSFVIGIPVFFSANKFPEIEKYLRFAAGVLSIWFGIFLIYELISHFPQTP